MSKTDEWFDALPDPKDVGESEYSVIHSVLEGAIAEAETEKEKKDIANAVLGQFRDTARRLLDSLWADEDREELMAFEPVRQEEDDL